MDTLFDWVIEHFRTEWLMIWNAPILFFFMVGLVGVALYFVLKGHFSERLEIWESAFSHKRRSHRFCGEAAGGLQIKSQRGLTRRSRPCN